MKDFLLYVLVDNTNKALLLSKDGGRIGNSHPFKSKNKCLLMIWTIRLLKTAAAWSLNTWKRGAHLPGSPG